MGRRKKNSADRRKEANKTSFKAILNDCPTSPRKMRLVIDLIRGIEVNKAIGILKYTQKEAARRVEKLLLSAIANWQNKNEGARIEDANLVVKEAFVDGGRMLKRLRPAPQGRGYRVRKRSNHVTLILGTPSAEKAVKVTAAAAEKTEAKAKAKAKSKSKEKSKTKE